jgi:hypothetical protein
MGTTNQTTAETGYNFPDFVRLNYFYGQMLCADDFTAEQVYFREKMKLHNRCLHGYGTVCGLRVGPYVPPAKKECDHPAPPEPWITIEPGLALDSEGNELIVRDSGPPLVVNLWEQLSAEDRKAVENECDKDGCFKKKLYICLHHVETPLCPSTPIVPSSCNGTLPNQFKKYRDGVRVSVSLTEPKEDTRCGTCCCEGPCACDGLYLASIDRFHRWHHEWMKIHNEVRRRISTYQFTTITGVNWHHGAHLPRNFVRHLLHQGLVIHFSRPVLAETLKRGVVDVYQIESKSTRHANIIELCGQPGTGTVTNGTTQELHYKIPHLEECPEPGDRVLIVVRSGFILDECCRPVDGLNVGGRVPYVPCDPPYPEALPTAEPCERCAEPPWGYAPWISGNGTGGGTFESWFYVRDKHDNTKQVGEAE